MVGSELSLCTTILFKAQLCSVTFYVQVITPLHLCTIQKAEYKLPSLGFITEHHEIPDSKY